MTKPNDKATKRRKPVNWGERRERIAANQGERKVKHPYEVVERNDDIRRAREVLGSMDPAERDILWNVHVEEETRSSQGNYSPATASRRTKAAENEFRRRWGEDW